MKRRLVGKNRLWTGTREGTISTKWATLVLVLQLFVQLERRHHEGGSTDRALDVRPMVREKQTLYGRIVEQLGDFLHDEGRRSTELRAISLWARTGQFLA
jgi:hypothetical protein